MKKLRVVFYKAKVDGKIIDNAIRDWTWIINLPYKMKHEIPFDVYNRLACSHVELWLPNTDTGLFYTIDNHCNKILSGFSYTSTMGQTGGKNRKGEGVCKRPAKEVYKHPERWFFFEIGYDNKGHQRLIESLEWWVINNKGYDKRLILRYLGITIDDPYKFICSEFVDDALINIKKETPYTNPSPFRMALHFWKSYVIKELKDE